MQFEAVVEEEFVKGRVGNDGKIESQWTRLKDAIKAGATKVFGNFGFKKGKVVPQTVGFRSDDRKDE